MQLTKESIAESFRQLQDDICSALENIDGSGQFKEDQWQRPGGGGGRSRVIEGQLIEKGGVNFSAVHGALPDKIAAALKIPDKEFFATGVSIVLHPHHPYVPIIHMNVRFFETSSGLWWFGGGIDLTPHYINAHDAKRFHQKLKATCNKHHPSYYPKFKKWADDYFYVKHRKETRGVGGIFFDRLGEAEGFDRQKRFDFTLDVGKTFIPCYQEQVERNRDRTFTEREKNWQYLRRGRYVEFNLVWDRGTKFGLDTDGRIESILMSMPPTANWVYNHQPEAYSAEQATLEWLKKGIEWV